MKLAIPARHQKVSLIRPFVVSLVLGTLCSASHAFTGLNDAQNLIYDSPHMRNTSDGQKINYLYQASGNGEETLKDLVTMEVTLATDDEKRDVSFEFLTAERRMPLPDFTAYRGNPVIIAMLEHIAQSFGRETGGGVLYFRNRIRDALSGDDVGIEIQSMQHGDDTIEATLITFTPFSGDTYLADKPEYTTARFEVALSEDVPGGVVAVEVESSTNGDLAFRKEIRIE